MKNDLNNINLNNLNDQELEVLASDIREFLVDNVSKTGGHLGSNLGVVELSIIMHQMFNSPEDKIIFDVGHQGYVHKILTGRAKDFNTLRQMDGLSGFLKREESEHDIWEAGHSSTSISAACGFALARDLDNKDNEVICVIGDGSLTNGMSLEALNHLAGMKTKVIIVINDNEMSISNNVGFIDDILKNIQLSQGYEHSKTSIKNVLSHIPKGEFLIEKISTLKNKIKNKISASQSFFNLMGFDYIGPVDGHNFKDLRQAFNYAKKCNTSIIIHVKTTKGKGYLPAVENSWHGVPPFDKQTGLPLSSSDGISNSKLIANGIKQLMKEDEDIIVITPAMGSGSELEEINKEYPDRYEDVGIAEEHAITFSAGLALAGKKPFCCIYSTFLQRSYDQIFHDVVRQHAHVVIGIDRAGIVGQDGETHQGIYDLSFLLPMPDIVIVQGSNYQDILSLLNWSFTYDGPVCIRYPRGGNYMINEDDYKNIKPIVPFKWKVLKEHSNKYVISYGNQVNEILNNNLDCGLIDACFIKPLDKELLDSIKDKHLIIVEEHVKFGGLNTLIKDYLPNTKIDTIALDNDFIKQGKVDEILSKYNLCGDSLINKIEELFNE